MSEGKTRKIAGIAAVVLVVGGGAYLAGAKGLGACDAKAKAQNAALTKASGMTCEKVHASASSADGAIKAKNAAVTTASAADDCCEGEAKTTHATMVSKDGDCGAKVKNAVLTGAEACPYLKSHTAKTAVVSAQAGDCSEGACPMEQGASKKVDHQKAAPKRTMASVVPAAETTK